MAKLHFADRPRLARLSLGCPAEQCRTLRYGSSRLPDEAHQDENGAMKHKNSHLLVGYWGRLRKGRAVPDQTDIDPRAIKRMLSQIFILDATDAARPNYRLAGTSLCERFGLELRGSNFLSHWETQSAQALGSLLRQALRLKQPLCLVSI